MENTLLVTKITMQDMLNAVVDWIYGNDTASLNFSTVINLSSVPFQERQSTQKITEVLKDELGSNFFVDLDEQLQNTKLVNETTTTVE